jgi:predicted short-subunit dehydrogenase-like oxidoreductase (DUF2520 family)
MNRVSIIGTGRLGTSLGLALSKKGFTIGGLVDRSLYRAKRSRRIIGAGRATTLAASAVARADLVIIAVPDEDIASVAKTLARTAGPWQAKTVFHTSGIRPSRDLAPLKARGAFCASFHPVQSFPRMDMPPSHFQNIFIGLEGDEKAVLRAKTISRKLGGRPFLLRAGDKSLYHAACSMTSNLVIPVIHMAGDLLRKIGVPDRDTASLLFPLLAGTLRNVKHLGGAGALSGPISRGDVSTVKRHLSALGRFPSARALYRILGAEALRLVPKKKLPPGKIRTLRKLLEGK